MDMNALFRSVLASTQQYVALVQDQLPEPRYNHPLFNPHLPYGSLPVSPSDVTSRLSSLGLPAPISHELQSLCESEFPKARAFVEQVQHRLLEQLSTTSVSPDPSIIPSLVQSAFHTIYRESFNSRMDDLVREISQYSLQDGSGSESGDSSDSEEGSYLASCVVASQLKLAYTESDSDDGDDDEMEDVVDEDDNAPVRPGEDIPPLDTVSVPVAPRCERQLTNTITEIPPYI
jgi:hypothetical protein